MLESPEQIKELAARCHSDYSFETLVELLNHHHPNDNMAHVLLYQIGHHLRADHAGSLFLWKATNKYLETKTLFWAEKIVTFYFYFIVCY